MELGQDWKIAALTFYYSCAPFFVGDFMNNDDIYFMSIALKEAKKAYDKNEIPVGAVIVKNGIIIAKAHNLKESKTCVTKHAEIIALERASKKLKNWRLIGCTIYVTMFPCPMCASAINQSRISKLVYGTIPNYAEKEIVYHILNDKNYGASVEIVENILKDNCVKLLKKFFCGKR